MTETTRTSFHPPGRPGLLIVEEMDCTVVVPPGWRAALDERGCILMTRLGRDGSD